jgi:hypothetical protein
MGVQLDGADVGNENTSTAIKLLIAVAYERRSRRDIHGAKLARESARARLSKPWGGKSSSANLQGRSGRHGDRDNREY